MKAKIEITRDQASRLGLRDSYSVNYDGSTRLVKDIKEVDGMYTGVVSLGGVTFGVEAFSADDSEWFVA